MRASVNHLLKAITTGLIVLIFLSIPLFCSRFLCNFALISLLQGTAKTIRLSPSGLVPEKIENDPNVTAHSFLRASNNEINMLPTLGIIDYFISRLPGGRHSNIYWSNIEKNFDDSQWIYYDTRSGQIVCRYKTIEGTPGKNSLLTEIRLYAGPEGVSDIPDEKLGRFISPIVSRTGIKMSQLILYDYQLRRFFNINFEDESIRKGPQLPKDLLHKPVEIGTVLSKTSNLSLSWMGPQVRVQQPVKNIEERSSLGIRDNFPDNSIVRPFVQNQSARTKYVAIATNEGNSSKSQFLYVLDVTGRINLLNTETLEFEGTAGHLPAPQTYFPLRGLIRPKDLLAYNVFPFVLSTDHQYKGMFVAGVNREGTALALSVFDEKGNLIRTEQTKITTYDNHNRPRGYIRSSKAVYFNGPFPLMLTTVKYIIENLHPPILSVLSYFTSESFEAGSGHRALFILPNSFIAMKGRDVEGNFAERLTTALLLISPSLILSLILARRIVADARIVGLSKKARLFWIIGTISFGIVAYITYRLIRPKTVLVTCQNCGKPRRPDMDLCHQCKSKWHVPELIPPAWRVVD
jgi:hypothetical protein